jgi:hypothetical protein
MYTVNKSAIEIRALVLDINHRHFQGDKQMIMWVSLMHIVQNIA